MKILQLTTSLSFAGAEQVILDICSMPEHDFVIAALQAGDGSFKEKAKAQGIEVIDLKMKNKLDFSVFSRLKQLLLEQHFDCLHSHLVHANFVARIAAASTKTPVISTIHIVEKRFRPSHKWMEQFTEKKAAKITAVSQCVYDHILNNIKLSQDKIVLIPNGINCHRFKPTGQERDIDFLFLGRLDQQKGLDQILPAIKTMTDKLSLNVYVVGKGPEEQRLKQMAEDLNLNLNWIGFSDEPEKFLARSKVCLIPSRWEGFGLVAAEALASGSKVIHSGVDSLNSVTGSHAMVFDEDPELWAQQMIDCWQNFEEKLDARQWILDNFSREQMLNNYERLYFSCVASAD